MICMDFEALRESLYLYDDGIYKISLCVSYFPVIFL